MAAARSEIVQQCVQRIDDARKSRADELDALKENAVWLTTLAIAEIAGIAGYRQLQGAESLSIPFAFVICALGVGLVLFMGAAGMVRRAKRMLADTRFHAVMAIQRVAGQTDLSQDDGEARIKSRCSESIREIEKPGGVPEALETLGITVFLLASMAAAGIVGLSEVVSTFS